MSQPGKMVQKHHGRESRFLLRMAQAFLVFLACADVAIWGVAAKITADRGISVASGQVYEAARAGLASAGGAFYGQKENLIFGMAAVAESIKSKNYDIDLISANSEPKIFNSIGSGAKQAEILGNRATLLLAEGVYLAADKALVIRRYFIEISPQTGRASVWLGPAGISF